MRRVNRKMQVLSENKGKVSGKNKLPTDFVQAMAETRHELRTPLNHIIGYSELLIDQLEQSEQLERSEQKGNEAGLRTQEVMIGDLKKIQNAGHHLLSMLNYLLTPEGISKHLYISPGSNAAGKDTHNSSLSEDTNYLVKLLPSLSSLPSRPLSVLDPNGYTLLLVDDNPTNRDLLARLLRPLGFCVNGASNGKKALDMLRAFPYDLVFLDVMMPEMDGYQVLSQMQQDTFLKDIPVIMISALDKLDVVVRCIDAGAVDYLPKPFNPTLLKARLSATLLKKRMHDEERMLYTRLAESYQKLEQVERLREDLTQMLIQDLRIPLQSMLMSLDISQSFGNWSAEQITFQETAKQSCRDLLRMIENLLHVGQIEEGNLVLQRASHAPEDLLARVAVRVAETIALRELTLHLAPLDADTKASLVHVDGEKVVRALQNLVENAAKLSKAWGTVTLTADASSTPDALCFSVNYKGKEVTPVYFEKQGQLETGQDKENRRTNPCLGATYSKLITEIQGGHVQVNNHPKKGTTMGLVFPFSAERNESHRKKQEKQAA